MDWSALNPSLLASTILSARADQGSFCQLCQEVDHTATDCALHTTQDKPTSHYQTPGPSMNRPGSPHRPRPETLERICTSWNKVDAPTQALALSATSVLLAGYMVTRPETAKTRPRHQSTSRAVGQQDGVLQ